MIGFPLFLVWPFVQSLGFHFLLSLMVLSKEQRFDIVGSIQLIVQNGLKNAILAVLNLLGLDLSFAFHFILYNIFRILLRTFLILGSSFAHLDLMLMVDERNHILLG